MPRARPRPTPSWAYGHLREKAHEQRLKRNQGQGLARNEHRVGAASGASTDQDSKARARVGGYGMDTNSVQPATMRLREWDRSRRPISDAEGAHLLRLGAELRRLRVASGLSRGTVAYRSFLGQGYVGKLERGCRRTRRSTLTRIVGVLVYANPDLGPVEDLVDRLCELAGPALADETAFPRQVERTLRRKRRRMELFEARAERLHAAMSDQQTGERRPGNA